MNDTKYETRELESWIKMKEVRRLHFHHIWEAAEKGEAVVMGMTEAFLGYLSGLGDYADPSYGPYFTVLMRNPPELVKVLETFEAKGHPREICSAMRCYLGQLYAGMSTRSPKGGTIRPDFMFQVTNCHTMAQTAQLFSEYLGIPYLSIDLPYEDSPEAQEYVVAQLHEGIEWIEKTIGRKYDDERLIEATKNEWTCMQYWAEIVALCQAIPAPLDMRHLWSLRMPMLSMRHRKEAVAYTRALYEEVKWRVENRISARGMERIRFLHEGFPPFHFISILKQPTEYGAIFVLCENTQGHGLWEVQPDGTWKVGPTLEQRGLALRNRDDALQAQAELYLTRMMPSTWNPDRRPQEAVKRAQDWHCDAAVLGLDRGCHGYQTSILETKKALQQAGIPVGGYEHSQADPRDFSLPQVLDGLEAFMESLGLSKLNGHG
ncbi:MAG: 2-hydroxyacyl-CoA dehydratase subunit D [Dehalococcoidia bacterium]